MADRRGAEHAGNGVVSFLDQAVDVSVVLVGVSRRPFGQARDLRDGSSAELLQGGFTQLAEGLPVGFGGLVFHGLVVDSSRPTG